MATIPSFAQWKKDTFSITSPRSDFLKAVDTALEAYDASKSEPAKGALKTAFDRWRFEQSKQGRDWRKSTRNQKGARLEIPGMTSAKGIAQEKGTLEKVKDKVVDRLETWFSKPDKQKFDKALIKGYGHQAGGGFEPRAEALITRCRRDRVVAATTRRGHRAARTPPASRAA